ncbi:unnamed protein product [Cunninghamella echinulata]
MNPLKNLIADKSIFTIYPQRLIITTYSIICKQWNRLFIQIAKPLCSTFEITFLYKLEHQKVIDVIKVFSNIRSIEGLVDFELDKNLGIELVYSQHEQLTYLSHEYLNNQ